MSQIKRATQWDQNEFRPGDDVTANGADAEVYRIEQAESTTSYRMPNYKILGCSVFDRVDIVIFARRCWLVRK